MKRVQLIAKDGALSCGCRVEIHSSVLPPTLPWPFLCTSCVEPCTICGAPAEHYLGFGVLVCVSASCRTNVESNFSRAMAKAMAE